MSESLVVPAPECTVHAWTETYSLWPNKILHSGPVSCLLSHVHMQVTTWTWRTPIANIAWNDTFVRKKIPVYYCRNINVGIISCTCTRMHSPCLNGDLFSVTKQNSSFRTCQLFTLTCPHASNDLDMAYTDREHCMEWMDGSLSLDGNRFTIYWPLRSTISAT